MKARRVIAGLLSASALAAAAPRGARTADLPVWPQSPQPDKGAPNVLMVLTDDVGFAASSTFSGPVPTPALDRLRRADIAITRSTPRRSIRRRARRC